MTDPAMKVMIAVTDASQLAGVALRAVRSERARVKIRRESLVRKRDGLLQGAVEDRAVVKVFKKTVPFLGGLLSRKHGLNADKKEGEAAELFLNIGKLKKRMDRLDALAGQLQKLETALLKAIRGVPHLGLPPKSIEDRSIAISAQCFTLTKGRRSMDWSARCLEVSKSAVKLVRDWAETRMKIVKAQQPVLAAPAVSKRIPSRRIYLPIPSVMSSMARDLGALRDSVAGRGVSPWYVMSDSDLKPFRNLLPLAYRPEVEKFKFPPVPFRASGQNLWSFFDRPSWRRIRQAASYSSGSRCVICGGRGGFIADKILGAEENRHGVDCHEVWDWSVEDESTGIGVQSLQKMLIVCPSCHACFHSGYFIRRGQEVGMGEDVREHIAKRRMLINRMGMEELEASIEASKEEMRSIQGVDKWIIDLEHVGRQQFVTDHVPIMNERNAANVPPERIAGIAFETESGEKFPARSAEEIYAELLDIHLDDSPSSFSR